MPLVTRTHKHENDATNRPLNRRAIDRPRSGQTPPAPLRLPLPFLPPCQPAPPYPVVGNQASLHKQLRTYSSQQRQRGANRTYVCVCMRTSTARAIEVHAVVPGHAPGLSNNALFSAVVGTGILAEWKDCLHSSKGGLSTVVPESCSVPSKCIGTATTLAATGR